MFCVLPGLLPAYPSELNTCWCWRLRYWVELGEGRLEGKGRAQQASGGGTERLNHRSSRRGVGLPSAYLLP